jgi:hypothetical protein
MVSYRSSFLNDSVAETGYFAVTVKQLFYVALSIGSFLVFLAICVFLVVRIVMLWILLMLSPLAYAAGVLPAPFLPQDVLRVSVVDRARLVADPVGLGSTRGLSA